MAKARVTLREYAVIRLNGSGAGTARVGPLTAREIWYPSNVSIKTTFPGVQTVPTNESKCDIFVGQSISPEFFRDTSFQGSTGDASGACSADIVRTGQYVWAVWSGGDAGVQATLTVTGVKDV
jgi:hypothetical protein